MNKSRTKNKIEDIGLYYCTKCKKVWEYRKRYGMYAKISPPIVLKYGHIPSYGKERIICPECE